MCVREVMRMSDFLYSAPSFLDGMGAAIDLGGTRLVFNESRTPEEADKLAMCSDFKAVGEDIRQSVKALVHE